MVNNCAWASVPWSQSTKRSEWPEQKLPIAPLVKPRPCLREGWSQESGRVFSPHRAESGSGWDWLKVKLLPHLSRKLSPNSSPLCSITPLLMPPGWAILVGTWCFDLPPKPCNDFILNYRNENWHWVASCICPSRQDGKESNHEHFKQPQRMLLTHRKLHCFNWIPVQLQSITVVFNFSVWSNKIALILCSQTLLVVQ